MNNFYVFFFLFFSLVASSEEVDVIKVFPSGVISKEEKYLYVHFNQDIVEKKGVSASEFASYLIIDGNSCRKAFWLEKNILVCELRDAIEINKNYSIQIPIGMMPGTEKVIKENKYFDLIYKKQSEILGNSLGHNLQILSVRCGSQTIKINNEIEGTKKREIFLKCDRGSEIAFSFTRDFLFPEKMFLISNSSRKKTLLMVPQVNNQNVMTFTLPNTVEQLSFVIDKNVVFSQGETFWGASEFHIEMEENYNQEQVISLSKEIPEIPLLPTPATPESNCMIGEKSWGSEGIEICPREFFIEVDNGLKGNLYSFSKDYRWNCSPTEFCEEPEEYKKVFKDEIFVLGYGGLSSGVWVNEVSEIDVCGDHVDYYDESTKQTINYKPTEGKSVKSFYRLEDEFVKQNERYPFSFALHSFGPIKKNESYKVTDIYTFEDSQPKLMNFNEALKIPGLQELIGQFSFPLTIDSTESNGYKIINIRENTKEKSKSAGLMIDPDGIVVYSWKIPDDYDCMGRLKARAVMKINGHTVVVGQECSEYFPDLTFVLVKVKSSYLRYKRYSNYSIC